tara:strand:+ start:2659 stop:2919 length:261 start_codon:yes stop_codon:yes gene_type:complete
MTLIGIILKLIESFTLCDTKEQQQLHIDSKNWEKECVIESDDKVKSLYAKLHDGVFFRLLAPFVYFYLVRYVKDLMTGGDEDNLLD